MIPTAPATREAISMAIRVAVGKLLKLDPAEIAPDRPLNGPGGLGLQSLELFELLMQLEDTYGVRVDDERLASLRTADAIADYVLELKRG